MLTAHGCRWGVALLAVFWSACANAGQSTDELPNPNYVRKSEDPQWLAFAAQFHGHLGPWATAGTRLGAAGRQAVQAAGYFDVDVTVEGPFDKPPRSCFLDGVQVGSGATLGKRNLHWVQAEKIVLRVKNTRTDAEVEVRPTPALREMLQGMKPKSMAAEAEHDHAHESSSPGTAGDEPVEALARQIAKMPVQKLAIVKTLTPNPSPRAPRSGRRARGG